MTKISAKCAEESQESREIWNEIMLDQQAKQKSAKSVGKKYHNS